MTQGKPRGRRIRIRAWRESWTVRLLVSIAELTSRAWWMIVRLIGAVDHLLGRDSVAARGLIAYHRLGPLMRCPPTTMPTDTGGRATECVARADHGYTHRNHATHSQRCGAPDFQLHGNVPIVRLAGTPAEMGRRYGELLAEPLRALSTCMDAAMPRALRERFLAMTAKGEAHLPDSVREEIAAMADASGAPYDHLAALNVVTRIACTTVAARDEDGRLIMGRNGDFFGLGIADRAMMVLVRRPADARATATVGFLGMVGAFTGINDAGVAYGNMIVFNAAGPKLRLEGLPIQIAIQQAAERAGSADEMIGLLRAQSHVAPMNVMAADAHDAQVAELSLAGTAARRMEDPLLVATNHFRTPELQAYPERCQRYDRLTANGDQAVTMTVADMKRALHRNRVRLMNLQAVVFEPAAMRMHVAVNRLPASAGPYVALDLARLFAS